MHAPTVQTDHPHTVSAFDRHWIRGYAWTGVLAGALVTMPTSLAEIAIIPPALFFLPMCARSFPLWRETVSRPAFLFLLAFASWLALGLVRSPDRALGIEEFGNLRFFAVALLLTPAIRTTTTGRGAIIASVCVGFLAGNLVQGLNAWALHGGGPGAFLFGRTPQRMSGWWDPAVAGTILTAALGLHLPAALMGRGRTRIVGASCVCVTLVGLLMTGSRGGWIASGLLLSLVATVALWRAIKHKAGRRATLATLAASALVLAIAGVALRAPIADRVSEARTQITDALNGEVTGYTGIRIALKQEAIAAFLANPIAGVGTGGYSAWVEQHRQPASNATAPLSADRVSEFDHAHDTILHLAASNGLIGVGLFVALFIASGRDAWRWAKQRGPGTYHAGPLFALVGLALTTPFDTLHVSASAAAVTGMIVALCIAPPRSSPHTPIDISEHDRERAQTPHETPNPDPKEPEA